MAEAVTARRVVGPSRVLALLYGFFTLAAGARSGVQIATKFADAPLAYVLSGVAAGIYGCGLTVMVLAERDQRWVRWLVRLCLTELTGVAAVGTASLIRPSAFPDQTVWSSFGEGYGFVPIALPILALLWAHRVDHG